jgi:hypothetical protein
MKGSKKLFDKDTCFSVSHSLWPPSHLTLDLCFLEYLQTFMDFTVKRIRFKEAYAEKGTWTDRGRLKTNFVHLRSSS